MQLYARDLDSHVLRLQVDDRVVTTIAENTQLHSLNLSNTSITSDGLASLSGLLHLSKVELNQCEKLNEAIPVLKSLINLQHVSVSQSRQLSPCYIISSLKNATKITYLDLSWCQSSAGSARRALVTLPKLQQLHTLCMDNACLPVELFTSVLLLPNLSRLGACGHSFPTSTDIPLALLTRLFRVPVSSTVRDEQHQCSSPRIQANTAEDSGEEMVSSLTAPANAHGCIASASILARTVVGDQARRHDKSMSGAPTNKAAWENHFDGPAMPFHTPTWLLQRLTTLTSLRLRWANVRTSPGDSKWFLLPDEFTKCSATLQLTSTGSDYQQARSHNSCPLHHWSVQLSSQAWGLLALLPSLEHLDAAFTNVKNDTICSLAPLQGLTSLDLDSTYITDNGMHHISAFSALQRLNLSDTKCAPVAGSACRLLALKSIPNRFWHRRNCDGNSAFLW